MSKGTRVAVSLTTDRSAPARCLCARTDDARVRAARTIAQGLPKQTMDQPGKKLRLAVIGCGKLGRACGETVLGNEALQLAGFVRRNESVHKPLPNNFRGVATTSNIATLGAIDAALLCVPAAMVGAAAYDLLQHRIPIVECAIRAAGDFESQRERLHDVAQRHRVAAVWGAGRDPGAFSLLRRLFTLLIPKGHTETTGRPGVSLHHTVSATAIDGVRDALSTEVHSVEGKAQRYVYVELAPGAEAQRVTTLIRGDPRFLDAETLVFPVESVAALEQQGHGTVLARRGSAGAAAHQMLLFEARFDAAALAAQVHGRRRAGAALDAAGFSRPVGIACEISLP